jgi:hypothetical protein
VDKELFKSKSQVGLKNPAKPFPLHTDVGVLKWRFQTQDESCIPLSSKYYRNTRNVEDKTAFGTQYRDNECCIGLRFGVHKAYVSFVRRVIFRGTKSGKNVRFLQMLYLHVNTVSNMFVSLLQSVILTKFLSLLEFSFMAFQCMTNTNVCLKLVLIY